MLSVRPLLPRIATIVGATAILLSVSTAKAAPITIDFSFTADFGTTGQVTGALVFAAPGTGVAATDVYVFTAPTGSLNASAMNVDYLPLGIATANAFTITAAGAVTAANLFIYSPDGSELLNLDAASNSKATFVAEEQAGGGFSSVFPDSKFKSVSYTVGSPIVLPVAVPEPASFTVLALGCIGLVGVDIVRRRRNRQSPAI